MLVFFLLFMLSLIFESFFLPNHFLKRGCNYSHLKSETPNQYPIQKQETKTTGNPEKIGNLINIKNGMTKQYDAKVLIKFF